MTQQILDLVSAAATEAEQVIAAETALSGAVGELTAAQQVVADKQTAVDASRAAVATERTEAIDAWRAVVAACQAEIAKLDGSAGA
jgi:hypothetical protein